MNGYVIKRTDQDGGYLARPGSEHSYTRRLEHAQVFPTRESADNARCPGNEVVIPLSDVFGIVGYHDRKPAQ